MSIVMCRAPFRISFFGGGSDYPEWYRHEGGAVLSTDDRQVHLHHVPLPAAVPRHQAPRRLALCRAGRLDRRNSASGRARGAALSRFRRHPRHRAALSGRSAVALGHGVELDLRRCAAAGADASARDRGDHQRLAEMAIELEQVRMKETVGSQDQVAAAFGGLNVIKFHQDGRFDVHPIRLGDAARARSAGQPHAVLPGPQPVFIRCRDQRDART